MSYWSSKKAYFYLIGSTCITLLLSIGSYAVYKKKSRERLQNKDYFISSIVQTGPEKEALKTTYLAELLDLSIDEPSHLYRVDLKVLEEKLLASPLIASAKIKRAPPTSIYIDYEVRKPVAWLSDFKNMAIDKEGYIFPVSPFFSPKNLPELYLGLSQDFHKEIAKVTGPYFELGIEILQNLETTPWKEGLRIKRVDVSNAFTPSLGTREIVLITEEEISVRNEGMEVVCKFPKILRLAPKDYPHQLKCFFSLRRTMMDQYVKQLATLKEGGSFAPRIIDLRIPQLAFVEKG